MNYYNENDPKAAAWLRELIKERLIPDGDVDERSIADVRANDLLGYAQCHFFAGIGGWSLALQLAGWPRDREVWTGSCPCQPFSVAGKGKGEKDERHLWPHFKSLIDDGSPPVVFGEQVASKAGRGWLDGVRLDLEAMGYAVGAADLCAASVNAPHIRQRLYWVAYAASSGRGQRNSIKRESLPGGEPEKERIRPADGRGSAGGLAYTNSERLEGREEPDGFSIEPEQQAPRRVDALRCGDTSRLGDSSGIGLPRVCGGGKEGASESSNPWDTFDLLPCTDGKTMRIESKVQCVADGFSSKVVPSGAFVPASSPLTESNKEARRVMRLRGYGNAINPYVASEFIESFEKSIYALQG